MPIIALENNAIKARNAEKQQILKGLEQEIVLSEKILDGLKQLERTQKAKDQHEAEIRATKTSSYSHGSKNTYRTTKTSRKSLRAQISAI